jgi:hypothetical protein
MKVLYFQLLAVFVISCVGKNEVSEPFADFDGAGDLDCQSWQKDEQTLGIYDLIQSRASPVAFLAKVRRRNNELQYHFRALKSGKLDVDQTRQIFLPPNVRILGVTETGNSDLITINPENEFRLEIRQQPNNKIIYSDLQSRKPTYNEKIVSGDQSSFWFVYSIDEDKARGGIELYSKVSDSEGSSYKVKRFKNVNIDPSKDLFVVHNEALVVLYPMESKSRSWIEYQVYKADGSNSPRVDLSMPIKNKVDKWSAVSYGEMINLAVVDGDSFLRQTSLRVASLKLDNHVLKTNWLKTRSLMNFHVSAPVWSSNSKDLSILIPKWLDGKSTIARYQVQSGGVAGTGHLGQFPRAAMITDSYTDKNGDARYLVVRTKDQVGWSFDICRME